MQSKDLHPDRVALYADMSPHHLAPLWEVLYALVPQQPNSPCVAAHWKYDEVRPFLMRTGKAITAEEAIRRVRIGNSTTSSQVRHGLGASARP